MVIIQWERNKDNLFQVLEKSRSLVESKDQLEEHQTLYHLTMVGGSVRSSKEPDGATAERQWIMQRSREGVREL